MPTTSLRLGSRLWGLVLTAGEIQRGSVNVNAGGGTLVRPLLDRQLTAATAPATLTLGGLR